MPTYETKLTWSILEKLDIKVSLDAHYSIYSSLLLLNIISKLCKHNKISSSLLMIKFLPSSLWASYIPFRILQLILHHISCNDNKTPYKYVTFGVANFRNNTIILIHLILSCLFADNWSALWVINWIPKYQYETMSHNIFQLKAWNNDLIIPNSFFYKYWPIR